MPVVLLAEIPFMMAKFAVFDAFSKLAYSAFPQAAESVAASLAVSLISGMVGETEQKQRELYAVLGVYSDGATAAGHAAVTALLQNSLQQL